MTNPQKFPKVWELLERFKENCSSRGWKTSDYEDIIKIQSEYHNFIGALAAHPSTFERIASSQRRAIREGKSYRPIEVSYTAWIFQQPPSEKLVKTLTQNSKLAKNNALYDLSSIYKGKPFCLGLNLTESPGIKQFEKFLKETYGIETKNLYQPTNTEPKTFKSKLQKASVG